MKEKNTSKRKVMSNSLFMRRQPQKPKYKQKFFKHNRLYTHDGNFLQRITILGYKRSTNQYNVMYEDKTEGYLCEDDIYTERKEYLIKKLKGGIIKEVIPQPL